MEKESHWITTKSGGEVHLTPRQWNMKKMEKIADKRKKNLRKYPTPAEIEFGRILKSYKIPYRFQKLVYTPHHFYILDFVITMKPRTILEIDGNSHYGRDLYDKEREEDILSTRTYRRSKWSFLRIRNEQVFNGEAEKMLRQRFSRFFRKHGL